MDQDLDYEKDWQEFWKDIVCDENEELNLEQIKKELSDYHYIMHQAGKINCYMTNNRLSYPNYPAQTIIDEHNQIWIDKKYAREDILNIVGNELSDDTWIELKRYLS
jgi:hypothetical protein